jgi:hypothetical protein
MFVRDFLHVSQPFEVVAPRFLGTDLPIEELAHEAITEACASLASGVPQAVLDGIRCTRGALRSRGEAIVVPIRCVNDLHAAGPASLEGELEVAPVGTTSTELGFEASYQRSSDDPSLPGDMRRVTELGVRAFLHALGRALEE